MAGFENDIVYALNGDFSQADNQAPAEANGLITNGELWIGSTALNAGNTHINVGQITSSTLTIGYSSPNITIDSAGGSPITSIGVQGSSPPGTNPVLPDGAGQVDFRGLLVAAGTDPLIAASTLSNTVEYQIQLSTALAAADSTRVGLSNFSNVDFAVAGTGFVTLSTTGAGKTITGDTGGPLSPVANNWNILGGPGVTTSGSGSTLTINSTVFTDTTATTMAVDNGYFATAAGTYNLPATAAQGELITIVCDTAGAVVVDAPALNFIRVGSLITAAGGTATSTAIGDSLTLRYRLSTLTWEATSVIGVWLIA